MKKLRLLLAGSLLASLFVVTSGTPANASCVGDPDVCAVVCAVGYNNKYTHDLFQWCEVV
ncbi:MAG: hypothetical protein ACLGHL_04855 [Actinomycetota bacterium]